MADIPYIDPVLRARIEVELTTTERAQGVAIVLAVESGSRAWRFPSRDSDYDVRFLYLRPIEEYLRVTPRRDVIERPVDAVLDVNGWDLRKALQLLIRSNAVLIEWLRSPERYRDVAPVSGPLHELAIEAADLTSLAYHYDHQARRSAGELADDGPVRLKTYFYALRSVLALTWIRVRLAPPPMDLPALMAGLDLPQDVASATAELLVQKREATEKAATPRIACLDRLIAQALALPMPRFEAADRRMIGAKADALFASILLGRR